MPEPEGELVVDDELLAPESVTEVAATLPPVPVEPAIETVSPGLPETVLWTTPSAAATVSDGAIAIAASVPTYHGLTDRRLRVRFMAATVRAQAERTAREQ